MDPAGTDRHEIALEVEVVGQKIKIGGSYDDESQEISVSATGGIGIGVGGEFVGEYERTESSERGNSISLTGEVKASAELGGRAGKDNSLVVDAEASLGRGSITNSTDKSYDPKGPKAEAAVVIGPTRRSTDPTSRTPDRFGAAAKAGVTAELKVEMNVSVGGALKSARDLAGRAREFVRRWTGF